MPKIKTDNFEGPLELLLDLIEKNKLSINHVSLARIADDFVMEVKSRVGVIPDEIAQFLVVASTLMLIKSRSLLPNLPISEEEQEDMEHLEKRLQQLRRMRELSRHIAERSHAGMRMYGRTATPELPSLFYPPVHITKETLCDSIHELVRALSLFKKRAPLIEKTLEHVVSLEEKIIELASRVESSIAHSFSTFVGSTNEKSEIIVSFLALLELVKQGQISTAQKSPFGDISMQLQK